MASWQSATRSHWSETCSWLLFLIASVTQSVLVSSPRLWLGTEVFQLIKVVVVLHRFVAWWLTKVTIRLKKSLSATHSIDVTRLKCATGCYAEWPKKARKSNNFSHKTPSKTWFRNAIHRLMVRRTDATGSADIIHHTRRKSLLCGSGIVIDVIK